ncbi:MAG: hypothetical protein ABI254_08285 [Chthoniobacterales bacterium]
MHQLLAYVFSIVAALVVLGVVILCLVPEWLDKIRIRSELKSFGAEFISMTEEEENIEWVESRYGRTWRVVYRDTEGNEIAASCTCSFLTGLNWRD